MFNKLKNWLFPKQEEFVYKTLVQVEPERKVKVMKKSAAKKSTSKKKAPAKKAPVKKTVKKSTKKK